MKVFCYIPPVCLEPGEIASQVRRLLAQALERGLTPSGVPRDTNSLAVDIDQAQLEIVRPLAEQLGTAPGRVIGALIYANYLAAASAASGSQVVQPNLQGLRPGQERCIQEAAPMLANGKVVLAECGTGSGKSRLIAHAAAYVHALQTAGTLPSLPGRAILPENVPDFLRSHIQIALDIRSQRLACAGLVKPKAIIVCAPSVENVSHLCKEWNAVRGVLDKQRAISSAIVLGRSQFVSPSRVAELIASSETGCEPLDKWLKKGMPPGLTPASKHIANLLPNICGLMVDLEYLSQQHDFPCPEAELGEDSPNEEQTLYQELRAAAFHADLVFTTHAMVCLDNMLLATETAKALLPAPAAILVDEAHTFEQIQADMAAKSLSLPRLIAELRKDAWKMLRKESAAQALIGTVKRASIALSSIPNETPLPISLCPDPATVAAWSNAQPALQDLAHELDKLIKGATKKNADAAFEMRPVRYVKQASSALDGISKGYRGYVGHSPVRGALSFSIGPTSVSKHMAARWATTPCVMLLSGTLLHIGASGTILGAVVREFALPADRVAYTTPMHPAWITQTPVVYTPARESFHRLVPPGGEDINELSLAAWAHECTQAVALAATDARGGMLVLTTGYDRIDTLAQDIRKFHPGLVDRLIVQSRTQRVTACAGVFKAMWREGIRPIWLATGAAGVGLDLADETVSEADAHKDFLLTDLVIANLPFGLDKNTTHVHRVNKLGFGLEAMSTQRRFRQWLGRLVRREGLKHRRIWVLDGRLQHPAASHYTADLRRVLDPYIHKMTFWEN